MARLRDVTLLFSTYAFIACGSSEGGGTTAAAGRSAGGQSGGNTNPNAGSQATAGSSGQAEPVLGDLQNSADSVRVSRTAGRVDPEGIAPKSPEISELSWRDARGALRTMSLYGYLYQYDYSFVGGEAADREAVTARSAGDDAYGHAGFGYVVSHNTVTGNSPIGKANAPSKVETTAFIGGHHAIHRVELTYDRDKEGGGKGIQIPVVIEWLVATGHDHPVWSVTWKMGEAKNPQGVDFDDYRMDVRGPYGSLNFDGASSRAQGDAIGGVAWGDAEFAFRTTDPELTLASSWTYDTPNKVNYSQSWTKTVNAEMGIVQTRPGDKSMGYGDYVVGRARGATSAAAYLGKGDCAAFGDPRVYSVPCISGWPYQLMNYDWDASGGKPAAEGTGTKLMAWGSPYGWLGASKFDLFDYSAEADGSGDRSYATLIVLGPKCRYDGAACDQAGDVARALAAVEALDAATITQVTQGKLAASAATGPGASSKKALSNGYNDSYAAYYLDSEDDGATFTFTPAAGKVVDMPIFVLRGVTVANEPTITVDGEPRAVNTGNTDSGAFVSYRAGENELWVTLNETLSKKTVISIRE